MHIGSAEALTDAYGRASANVREAMVALSPNVTQALALLNRGGQTRSTGQSRHSKRSPTICAPNNKTLPGESTGSYRPTPNPSASTAGSVASSPPTSKPHSNYTASPPNKSKPLSA